MRNNYSGSFNIQLKEIAFSQFNLCGMFLGPILILLAVINHVACCKNYNYHARKSEYFADPHVAVLILARGGSKGIRLKNLSVIGNTTLLEISLREVNRLIGVDSVWVSTDHELIVRTIQNSNTNIHWRSAESATDHASSLEAVQEFLRNHQEIDILGLVQCTSPFVKAFYLQQGLEAIQNGKDCSFSATRFYKLRWRSDGDRVLPVNFDPGQRPRRQDFRNDFVENGMFYFAKRNLIRKGYFQSDK